jgi:ammonium transporter, Amt family
LKAGFNIYPRLIAIKALISRLAKQSPGVSMRVLMAILAAAILTSPALAQPIIVSDSGDTAWILTSSALVLLMTLPGLALFYGGLVRVRNVLSVFMHCFAITAVLSLLWAVCGYTLVFGEGDRWLGGFGNAMLGGLADLRVDTTLPESAFVLFQMTFAIITPALIVGAFVERVKFGWVVAFSALWSLLVYVPVARWVWGGGWLSELGTLDFAGGIVVHATAGVAALVVAKLLGERKGFNKTLLPPHSPALTMTGAGLLWVGWFGFNGGSALAAGDDAATAILNTHLAACSAALIWALIERIRVGKSTSVGIVTGAVAGLATITPAAGFIGPTGAIILGAVGSFACFYAVQFVKQGIKIDDSLDVFAVHGVGGILGSILFPIFILPALGGGGFEDAGGLTRQLVAQLIGVGVAVLWSGVVTLIIGFGLSYFIPMRVDEEAEHDGLDLSSHGERGWELD